MWEKNENEEEEEEEENKKEKNKTNLRCLKIRDDGVLLRWQLFWTLPIFLLFTEDISEGSLYFIILKKNAILLDPLDRANLCPKF